MRAWANDFHWKYCAEFNRTALVQVVSSVDHTAFKSSSKTEVDLLKSETRSQKKENNTIQTLILSYSNLDVTLGGKCAPYFEHFLPTIRAFSHRYICHGTPRDFKLTEVDGSFRIKHLASIRITRPPASPHVILDRIYPRGGTNFFRRCAV